MKRAFLAIFLALGVSTVFTACNNGQYDADPNTNNSSSSNPLNPPGGSGGNGGGGGGSTSNFDWSGTDPLSAQIDGAPFQASSAMYTVANGMGFIEGGGAGSVESIQLYLPDNTTAGTVISFNTTAFANYIAGVGGLGDIYSSNTAQGGSGGVKILENDATHIKGLFYGTFKNTLGTSKTVSEGYFNVTK